MNARTTPTTRLAALGAMLGGAFLIAGGAIHLTSGDQVRTGETVETAIAHVMLATLTLALISLAPAVLELSRYARTRKPAYLAVAGMAMVAVATTVSNIIGEDRLFFFVTAPAGNVIWLVGTIGLALSLHRAGIVSKRLAIALPFVQVVSLPLSAFGGAILGGAFWIAVGYLISVDGLGRDEGRPRETAGLTTPTAA